MRLSLGIPKKMKLILQRTFLTYIIYYNPIHTFYLSLGTHSNCEIASALTPSSERNICITVFISAHPDIESHYEKLFIRTTTLGVSNLAGAIIKLHTREVNIQQFRNNTVSSPVTFNAAWSTCVTAFRLYCCCCVSFLSRSEVCSFHIISNER